MHHVNFYTLITNLESVKIKCCSYNQNSKHDHENLIVTLTLWRVDGYVCTVAKLRIELFAVATQSMLRAIILKS